MRTNSVYCKIFIYIHKNLFVPQAQDHLEKLAEILLYNFHREHILLKLKIKKLLRKNNCKMIPKLGTAELQAATFWSRLTLTSPIENILWPNLSRDKFNHFYLLLFSLFIVQNIAFKAVLRLRQNQWQFAAATSFVVKLHIFFYREPNRRC